jgi:hypothetical protein
MEIRCEHCDTIYDDAERLTYCPHDDIMPPADMAQKDAGLALIGKRVCFAHEPQGPSHAVQAVGWNGMVTIDDMAGEFAPHLFVLAP